MRIVRIGIEVDIVEHPAEGRVPDAHDLEHTTTKDLQASLNQWEGLYYFLLWVNGKRTNTPLRSYPELRDAIAKAVIESRLERS